MIAMRDDFREELEQKSAQAAAGEPMSANDLAMLRLYRLLREAQEPEPPTAD